MNELIKVNYENDRITTSARTLWEGLNEPWGQFTKWFDNYKEYGFTENKDYKDVSIKILTSHGREHDAQDYEITINMAKQLAMLQKTPEGKMYREYSKSLSGTTDRYTNGCYYFDEVEADKLLKELMINRIWGQKNITNVNKRNYTWY